MAGSISQEALGQLFVDARSYNGWQDKPLSDETLIRLYELMKWGPTSANCSPARIVFVKGAEAKERLIACLAPLNVNKVKAAPVTAITCQRSGTPEPKMATAMAKPATGVSKNVEIRIDNCREEQTKRP